MNVQDFVDLVLQKGQLNDEQYDAGNALWREAMEGLSQVIDLDQLNIAPHGYCSDTDLPQGSTWIEVLSAAMDMSHEYEGDNHLLLMQKEMADCGLVRQEA